MDTSKGIADVPEWFRGSRLNYAENLLRHKENDKVALYVARESPGCTGRVLARLRLGIGIFICPPSLTDHLCWETERAGQRIQLLLVSDILLGVVCIDVCTFRSGDHRAARALMLVSFVSGGCLLRFE